MARIVVEVGKQMDGATFRLSPRTREMLSRRQLSAPAPPASLFVSYEIQDELERRLGSMSKQIVMILTGLTESQIRDLGGFSFVSPVDSEVLFESNAA